MAAQPSRSSVRWRRSVMFSSQRVSESGAEFFRASLRRCTRAFIRTVRGSYCVTLCTRDRYIVVPVRGNFRPARSVSGRTRVAVVKKNWPRVFAETARVMPFAVDASRAVESIVQWNCGPALCAIRGVPASTRGQFFCRAPVFLLPRDEKLLDFPVGCAIHRACCGDGARGEADPCDFHSAALGCSHDANVGDGAEP